MCKNGLHHSVLRAIIRWFMDRSDNGEWCALLTYKIGPTITILSQEAHFLVIQSSGKGVVGLVFADGSPIINCQSERTRPK